MRSWFTTTGRDDSQSGVPGTPLLGDMLKTHLLCGVPPETAESEPGDGPRQSVPEQQFLMILAHTEVQNHGPRVGF